MKRTLLLSVIVATLAYATACGAGSSKPASSSVPAPVTVNAATSSPLAAPTLQASAATPATNPVERVSGTVVSVDGNKVTLKEGGSFTLAAQTRVTMLVPASPADLQPGKIVAVTAKPQPDSSLLASLIRIFPVAPSATFFSQFALGDGNLMTNATIDKVTGNSFTVTFPGGGAQVRLAPDGQVAAITPGAQTDIKPGAVVTAMVTAGVAQSVSIS